MQKKPAGLRSLFLSLQIKHVVDGKQVDSKATR